MITKGHEINEETERLLKTEEVARRLAVTPRTVQQFIKDGKLQVVRLGRRAVRVRQSAVLSFIDELASE